MFTFGITLSFMFFFFFRFHYWVFHQNPSRVNSLVFFFIFLSFRFTFSFVYRLFYILLLYIFFFISCSIKVCQFHKFFLLHFLILFFPISFAAWEFLHARGKVSRWGDVTLINCVTVFGCTKSFSIPGIKPTVCLRTWLCASWCCFVFLLMSRKQNFPTIIITHKKKKTSSSTTAVTTTVTVIYNHKWLVAFIFPILEPRTWGFFFYTTESTNYFSIVIGNRIRFTIARLFLGNGHLSRCRNIYKADNSSLHRLHSWIAE